MRLQLFKRGINLLKKIKRGGPASPKWPEILTIGEKMLDEIKSAIEKNLPTQVGKVLQEELAAGAFAKKQVQELGSKIAEQSNDISKMGAELKTLRELQIKKEEVEKKERDYEITKLKHELEVQKSVNNQISNFVSLVVKNPQYTQYGNIPMLQPTGNGYSNITSQSYSNTSEVTK